MSVSEKQLPFSALDDVPVKDKLEPGFFDRILIPEQMYKEVAPYHIKTGIQNCFACSNKSYKKPLELANFNASVMVIGETPDDVNFDTDEGKLLADILMWAGYDLSDVYMTSSIKCESSASPDLCQSHLISEVLCVQPKLIIALGYETSKRLEPSVNSAGHVSHFMNRFPMISTYRLLHAMANQEYYQEFCNHMIRAKQLGSKQ